jgi:hypothetical protein
MADTEAIEAAAALARKAVRIERTYWTALRRGDWQTARIWAAQRIPPETVYEATRAALAGLDAIPNKPGDNPL